MTRPTFIPLASVYGTKDDGTQLVSMNANIHLPENSIRLKRKSNKAPIEHFISAVDCHLLVNSSLVEFIKAY